MDVLQWFLLILGVVFVYGCAAFAGVTIGVREAVTGKPLNGWVEGCIYAALELGLFLIVLMTMRI